MSVTNNICLLPIVATPINHAHCTASHVLSAHAHNWPGIASSPAAGHSQFFNVTRRNTQVTLKNWEWPGDEASLVEIINIAGLIDADARRTYSVEL